MFERDQMQDRQFCRGSEARADDNGDGYAESWPNAVVMLLRRRTEVYEEH